MKRENKQMILIYILIFLVIVLIVLLTKVVLDGTSKKESEPAKTIEKLDIDPYPVVNEECTFDISLLDFNNLTAPGCENGYTRYNINDVVLNNATLPVSIIYSDINNKKVGLFVNNKRMTVNMENINSIVFGIFDNTLIAFDRNNNEANVLAFNSNGKKIYDLKSVLGKNHIKDLSNGETNISSKTLDISSFSFIEGSFEFNSISNSCQNGEKSKGSHYKVTYKDGNFEEPEFMNLINC